VSFLARDRDYVFGNDGWTLVRYTVISMGGMYKSQSHHPIMPWIYCTNCCITKHLITCQFLDSMKCHEFDINKTITRRRLRNRNRNHRSWSDVAWRFSPSDSRVRIDLVVVFSYISGVGNLNCFL